MDDMNANEKTRLDRIEEKIDKMADAIIALAEPKKRSQLKKIQPGSSLREWSRKTIA